MKGSNNHSPDRLIAFTAMLVVLVTSQLDISSITATSYVFGASSQYSLQIFRFTTGAVPAGSSLALTFDDEYIGRISNPTCISISFGSTILTCTYLGMQLTVNHLFDNSNYLNLSNFQITVTGITNPSLAKDYVAVNQLQIINPASTIVDSGTVTTTITITALPAQCVTTILNGYVFANGQISISYSSSYIRGASNSSYYLNIAMGTYYPDDSTQNLINPSFSQIVQAVESSGTKQVYSINFVTSFTIRMLMPPSNKPLTDIITITSFDKTLLGTIDTCSITVSNILPNTFTKYTISQATVQTYSALQFNLKLPTPLIPTDQLQINFPLAFDTSKITNSVVSITGYGNFPLSIIGNLLIITVNLTQPVFNAQLIFSISSVGLPFTVTAQQISVGFLTYDNYYRIYQTYQYTPLPGRVTATVSCLSVEIGTTTNCIFGLTISHSLSSNAGIQVVMPNNFAVGTGPQNCGVSGLGLNALATCLYSSITNTITATNLNSSTSNISPMSLSLNISMEISSSVGTYIITINTISGGSIVDTGTTSLTSTSRKLSNTQFGIMSSLMATYSPTTYTINLALPFDQGYVYTIILNIPVAVQQGLSPGVTNAVLMSYANSALNFTASSLLNTTFSITNLMTPISQQPITISISIYYQTILLFYGSQNITMTSMRAINSLSVSQSNQIVFNPFTATISISDLAIGDNIRISASYPFFYSSNQTNCSTNLVSCQSGGVVNVIAINNGGVVLTTFSVSLINQAYIGNYLLTFAAYDALNIYGKQSSSLSLSVTTPNSIAIMGSQTNPYLNQNSVYTFNLSFTTPNATYLLAGVSSNFTVISQQCNVNCGSPIVATGGYLFSLTSTWAVVAFSVVNPVQFNSSSIFSFQTSSSDGNKDYGQYQPQLICNAPCRSCLNSSICQTCYSWKPEAYLHNSTCITVCPTGTFATLNGNFWVCSACIASCATCSNSNSNCTTCKNGFYYYQSNCLNACPSNTFLEISNLSCLICQSPCSSCAITVSNCTGCLLSYSGSLYYYLQNTCYAGNCPQTYYSSLTNNTCYNCNSSCYTCTASMCLTCNLNNYLYNGVCYSVCPTGSYVSNGSFCSACPTICSTCLSLSVCTTCISGYYLMNGSCLASCPNFYFASVSGVCNACSLPCLLCNSSGCLSCNGLNYLSGQSCVTTCSVPLHPNNQSMTCQSCVSPCLTCSWSTICLSCINSYSILNQTCLPICPTAYYSNNGVCQACPPTCLTCNLINQQVSCSSCISGNLIYSYQCVDTCPNGTVASGQYCSSNSCDSLDHCLVCSGALCLQCNSLYTLNSNFSCNFLISSSSVLTALSQVPVPFPFLIGIIMVIVISFFLKHNYSKMFSPLFIYAIAGVLEQLCLILWTTLALLWNSNVIYPLPMISVVYGTILILIGYGIINIIQFVFWQCRIRKDRKYRLWQKQDNRCISVMIALMALVLSFRLDTIKFSRTGHSQKLSAILQKPQVFQHYSVLAILVVFINSASILVSSYVLYLQSSLNYLFFSCIEVAIVSVIMIFLSIIMLCIPKEQVIEGKGQYRSGHDHDQLEGPSLQQILSGLGIVEQQHHYNVQICSQSGNAVVRKDQISDDSNFQDITMNKPQQKGSRNYQDQDILFRDEEGTEKISFRNVKKSNDIDQIFQKHGAAQSENHILIDEIQSNKAQALELTKLYLPQEKNAEPLYLKKFGVIAKQRLQQLPENYSDSSVIVQQSQFVYINTNQSWEGNIKHQEIRKPLKIRNQFIKMDEQINAIRREGDNNEIKSQNRCFQKQGMNESVNKQQEYQKLFQLENHNDQYGNNKKKYKQLLFQQIDKQIQAKDSSSKSQISRLQYQKILQNKIIKDQNEDNNYKELLQQQINKENYKGLKSEIQIKKQDIQKNIQQLEKTSNQKQILNQNTNNYEIDQQQRYKAKQNKLDEVGKEIYRLNQLKKLLKQMEQQQTGLNSLQQQLSKEEQQLNIKKEEYKKTQYQQKQMEIEDQLSKTAQIFQTMKNKMENLGPRVSRKVKADEDSNKIMNKQMIKYSNNDQFNLRDQKSPKKIKIKPRPSPQQYKRQHIFVEQNGQIHSQSSEDRYDLYESDQKQDLQERIMNNKIQKEQILDKPKSILKRNQTAKNQYISHHMNGNQKVTSKRQEFILQKNNINNKRNLIHTEKIAQALAPIKFHQFDSQFRQQQQIYQQEPIIISKTFTVDLEIPESQQNQITVYNDEIIEVDQSSRSIVSNNTHWPIQPQLEERIVEIERKADYYIQNSNRSILEWQNHAKYVYETPTEQIYQEEQEQEDKKTINQILFQQSQQVIPIQELSHSSTKKRFPRGRVNRRVIDLAPDH